MANYELANTSIDDLMITVIDDEGHIVPAPTGDVFSVVSGDPAMLNAVIATMPSGPAAGAVSLRINALKKLSTAPITVTVTDSASLQAAELIVDIVDDLTPKTITLDIVDAVHTPQPVPAA